MIVRLSMISYLNSINPWHSKFKQQHSD